MFGWLEFILIAGALLLLFGGKRIPGLTRGIGKTLKNFRYAVRGDDDIKVKRINPEQDDENENGG
jgi:sec-independent protein translocase protein TatA